MSIHPYSLKIMCKHFSCCGIYHTEFKITFTFISHVIFIFFLYVYMLKTLSKIERTTNVISKMFFKSLASSENVFLQTYTMMLSKVSTIIIDPNPMHMI